MTLQTFGRLHLVVIFKRISVLLFTGTAKIVGKAKVDDPGSPFLFVEIDPIFYLPILLKN